MAINKKLKKLLYNPKLFFSDMLIKHREKINKIKPIKKYDGINKFTVISAVYGVEKYLEDYFKSLVDQRLDFKSHIHLILVDDGSLDSSAEIIKEWQKKYPNNITYLYKDNGGQASARNLGLEHVKTKWVTFIDPDDFVNKDYFLNINNFLENNLEGVAFVGCNLLFYFEDLNQYKDTHPLNYKFKKKGSKLYQCSDLENNIHMSSSSAVFSMDIIEKEQIRFDEKIRPSFEDASFISIYLLHAGKNYKAAFLSKAIYFYRKRADSSSTLDMAWSNPQKYEDVFIYGYLPLLKTYKKRLGVVPVYIQRQVLYDLVWYFKYLLNQDEKLGCLNDTEIENFYLYYKESFSYIDGKTIFDFELAKIWFYHKVLLALSFKPDYRFLQQFYIERYNPIRKEIRVSFFAKVDADVQILINGKDIIPTSGKVVPQFFARKKIGAIHYYYISISSFDNFSKLRVLINQKRSRINLKGKIYSKEIELGVIREQLGEDNKDITIDSPWVLMDRDTLADDNAEHLYRYIKNNYPERTIYYTIRKDSKDWGRLDMENFNLIDFGSSEHKALLKSAGKIISSHAEKHVHNYLPNNIMLQKPFVFLQHGVIMHDLSRWLNSKINLDLLVTSTYAECDSIKNNGSPYIFTNREVKLTGLPRHDALWEKNAEQIVNNKTILIMPTWRNWIVGELLEETNERTRNIEFEKSDYFKFWYSLLQSKFFKSILDKYGFSVIFAPHKNIEMYLDSFNLPSYIEVWDSNSKGSIQDLFIESSFMITDYSSVAFEMAYINKSTIYYQFDEDEIFSGNHTYQRGYFNYERDGFGPKVNTEHELLVEIENLCRSEGVIHKKYLKRIQDTFVHQDNLNSQRVYDALIAFDSFEENKHINAEILEMFLQNSICQNNTNLILDRAKKLIGVGNDMQREFAHKCISNIYFKEGRLKELIGFLELNDNSSNIKHLFLWLACIAQDYEKAESYYNKIESKELLDYYYMAVCSAYTKEVEIFNSCLANFKEISSDKEYIFVLENIYSKVLKDDWRGILNLEVEIYCFLSKNSIQKFKIELILSSAYRKCNDIKKAVKLLHSYESHTKDDAECRVEIANCAFIQGNYIKVVNQLNAALAGNYSYYPIESLYQYVVSLYKVRRFREFIRVKNILIDCLPKESDQYFEIKIRLYRAIGNHHKIVMMRDDILNSLKLKKYYINLLESYFVLGMFDSAKEISEKTLEHTREDDLVTFWKIVGKLSMIIPDDTSGKRAAEQLLLLSLIRDE